jgi:hypothetical protein
MIKTFLLGIDGWRESTSITVEADTIELLPNVNANGIALNNILVVNGAQIKFNDGDELEDTADQSI